MRTRRGRPRLCMSLSPSCMIDVMSAYLATRIAASIPSPSQGVWWIGPIPLRAYGILIMIGMVLGVWWAQKRYAARGGNPDVLLDAALWGVPLGIVGARTWHVVTHLQDYVGQGIDPMRMFYVWEGGIAIMGGVLGGALGVWLSLRRAGQRLGPVADSAAPALLLAQAIGRWGNWFNQELFGSPTQLPWGLEIDQAHLPPGYPVGTLFHPTFLYESLWNISMVLVILWVERRFVLKTGQVFALYLIVYPLGRFFIENIRLDEAYVFFGLRANAWAALVIFLLGCVLFFLFGRYGSAPKNLAVEEELAEDKTREDEDEAEKTATEEEDADISVNTDPADARKPSSQGA